MKLRVGACALMLVLAGCNGGSPESDGVAGMRGVAATGASGTLPSLPLSRAIGASIANAPDRGALMSYPNKAAPTKREGAYTWYPVAISEAHAFKGVATGEMTVPAPDGSQVKLRYERHVEEIDGNWTWIGRVVGGDPMQEAIITFGEKAVFGSIPQADGKPALSLQTRQGTVFAVQTDPSKVVSATKGHVDIMVPEAAALRSSMGAAVSQSAQVSQAATAVAQGAPQTSANTVDVAIGYTPEFATANNGASGAATRLVYLIQVGNQAFANSGVNGYLRIVNALQVSYTNTNTNQTALSELTGSNGQSSVTIPASLATLRKARDDYGADIAILVRKFNTPENAGCGIAWLNGAGQTAITAADAAWGYAVISDGYDQGTDGKTYYCADETLVHEAAHLMGSAHDRENSKTDAGALQYGRYAYSFGYKTGASNGNFYTVMAYGGTGQIAHRIFSTPLKSTCGSNGNLPCGVANSEDNARSLNQTIPIVANFRATVVPFAAGARNDVTGDGRSDILWRNVSSQQFSHWAMNDSSIISSAAKGMISSYYVAGTGDFNGDGLADILWKNDAARFLIIWQANGVGGYTQLEIGGFLPSLSFVGIGDFNGDGRSDILWHDKPANQLLYWAMNGRAPVASARYSMPSWFDILGVGDFNGDGVADIAYANASDVNLYLNNGTGTGFRGVRLAYRPAGWTLLGIADSNGNGISDFFWRNNGSGTMTIWGMSSSATVTSTPSYAPSTVLTFAALGDYNGDGRADILWERKEWRQLSVWLSRSSGYGGEVIGTYPAGWQVLQ